MAQRTPPQHGKLITCEAAAEYLSVSKRTIRLWIERGKLTGYRIGPRFVRVDLDEIDALIVRRMPSASDVA